MKKCIKCGKELTGRQEKYCEKCGWPRKKKNATCIACGAPLEKGEHKYCKKCRYMVSGPKKLTEEEIEQLPENFGMMQKPIKIYMGEGMQSERFHTGEAQICLNCPFPAEACTGSCFDSITVEQLKGLAKKRKEKKQHEGIYSREDHRRSELQTEI